MPDPNDTLLELTDALTEIIESFNRSKTAILKAAFDQGGDDEVNDLLEALDDIRNARSRLILRKLDTTAAGFEALTKEAKVETAKFNESIQHLKAASDIIGTAASVINILGRILIRFGL